MARVPGEGLEWWWLSLTGQLVEDELGEDVRLGQGKGPDEEEAEVKRDLLDMLEPLGLSQSLWHIPRRYPLKWGVAAQVLNLGFPTYLDLGLPIPGQRLLEMTKGSVAACQSYCQRQMGGQRCLGSS